MSQIMSFESRKSSMFTFQSSVHSTRVLQYLDEQRQKDVLCDVTVVVEERSFRAHRAVLAACSNFFQTRIASHVGQGLVITLPSEVTVEGFDPLLQFAYTAKLLFTKENILEIRRCAAILGFRNLDKACFEFLVPKFFDDTKDEQSVYRKSWWKKRCCKQKRQGAKLSGTVDDGDNVAEVELTDIESTDGPVKEPNKPCRFAKPSINARGQCSPITQERQKEDYCVLSPKYCGFTTREKLCLGSCSELATESNSGPSISEDLVQCQLSQSQTHSDHLTREKEVAMRSSCLQALSENTTATGFEEMQHLGSRQDVRSRGMKFKCCVLDSLDTPFHKLSRNGSVYGLNHVHSQSPTQKNRERDQMSSIEREVAEHLTSWSNSCEASGSIDPKKEDCPFLQELRDGSTWLPECERASIAEKSPCVSAIHSGEESDADTEGDSECCISERARKVQLPYSVEEISSLSRNEFQQLLKVRPLTQEQMDLVHDARRRSKNRMAAQRCRRRKLDCIHNLECEIDKLRSEKDKLLQEQNHLSQLRLKTRHSLSDLCQRVCREARLQPEQMEVLAKYSSPDCPLSVFMANMPHVGLPRLDRDHVQEPL
ncbi:transcription regulator protein BACH1b [Brienomyrus brachyistius]|uniref:transcription regulator protein BACH1b n=1 Tax=Brienomyrus brachyistius TaxID=42636 RepID=UPI0020B24C2B|nr:transcription regulator protein BACH1b [Brienomyrus brachyistius]XP_048840443.1 transcription regulator protein BACH1b [Brienomyrus brachyistius]XP_048840445.1 transcription regulator protein BACH1b [Brienomyrus brachyistius]XP_048840446.1 transcription regulator protein BACH1b [Brienomyrus brachyistius]XP_048840447.1 transcription regulator protein BACH1b [Brienomyrus brachyistius]XP_048840448.1 transcription regulator protein BACH1b [Brienomyrus brachyistius]